MINETTGWASAPLLARHYADLARLLMQFVLGPRKDGPTITLDQARKIVTKVYGRESRCTYGGLALVAPAILNAAIEAEIGEPLSIAEVLAFSQILGQMTINQPVCEQGHLPARWNGPTSIVLVGTDTQCPVCKALVADPDATEFLLIWNQRRLGHAAEDLTEGVDGRMVPTTAAGILKEIVALHPQWQRPVEGITPSIEEVAMVLMFGTADGKVTALDRESRVFAALKDPASVGLDAFACNIVLRKARGAWRTARNPFVARHAETAPPRQEPDRRPVSATGNRRTQVARLLVSLFSNGDEARRFATGFTDGSDIRNHLPNGCPSPTETCGAIAEQWDQRGLIDRDLFVALIDERPKRFPDINAVALSVGITDLTQPQERRW